LRVQQPGDADQALGEIGIDAPVAHSVGIGQGITNHRRTNPEMIELGTLRAQTYFDVSKALPKGQQRERHAQELIQARKGLHFECAWIAGHATTEGGQRKMLHQLRKHQLTSVHRCPHEVMLRRVAEPAFRVEIETKRIRRLSVSHQ
jgi:hypothetical protein